MQISLSRARLQSALFALLAGVASAGLAVEVLKPILSWVIPAVVVVAVFALAYRRFLAHFPRDTRNRFLLSGGIYVTGALVLELPLGYWTEQAGSNNVVYGLIDFVEQSMEMLGVNLFLLSLVDHLGVQGWTIGLSQAAPEPRPAPVERPA
ncbi:MULTISPECIES: hypothetical protein [Sorangium]|uniref:hypothetical protein n=1 Tax=Sorangium TaxID=39643 RepID=UPI003D9C5C4B